MDTASDTFEAERPMTREEFGRWIRFSPGKALDAEVEWAKHHGAAKIIGCGKGQVRVWRRLYEEAVARYCPAARAVALGKPLTGKR